MEIKISGTNMIESVIASAATSKIVKSGVGAIVKRSEKIGKEIKKDFEILSEEMTVLCPDNTQKYSIAFQVKKNIFNRSKKFEFGKVKRVHLRPLHSLQRVDDAVSILDNGFKISFSDLSQDDMYILDVESHIDNSRFIDSLVKRNVARETPTPEFREFWMHAQLKHLDALKGKYYNIDLRDVDFSVDVGIHQDIKVSIPSIFKDELQTIVNLVKSTGRSEKWKYAMQHLHTKGKGYTGKEFEILDELQDLFYPSEFCKFIDVKRQFNYHDCQRGTEFYETLPFPTWPKTMKVISRTDLNFENPASDGVLKYKQNDFKKEIMKVFE